MARRTASPAPPGGDDDLAALYRGPLAEFIDARNRLATRLRQAGKTEESARVKALPKPSAPAWALNQVYWHARKEYERLIAAGRSPAGTAAADARRTPGRPARGHAGAAGGGATGGRSRRALPGRRRTAGDGRHAAAAERDGRCPGDMGQSAAGLRPWTARSRFDPPGFAALASLGPPALRLVKSGRGGRTPNFRPGAAGAAATQAGAPRRRRRHSRHRQSPSAAEKAAAKRAAEKAAQEAARARQAEHRRLARALQDAERELRVRAAARDRAASALSTAAAGVQTMAREIASLERQLAALRTRLASAESALRRRPGRCERKRSSTRRRRETAARARRDLEQLEKS